MFLFYLILNLFVFNDILEGEIQKRKKVPQKWQNSKSLNITSISSFSYNLVFTMVGRSRSETDIGRVSRMYPDSVQSSAAVPVLTAQDDVPLIAALPARLGRHSTLPEMEKYGIFLRASEISKQDFAMVNYVVNKEPEPIGKPRERVSGLLAD